MTSRWRRYVYLVVNDFTKGTYPLRRIDASRLFFPGTAAATTATTTMVEEALPPRPHIVFDPPRERLGQGSLELFGLFGRGEAEEHKSLLAGVDYTGLALAYDLDGRVVRRGACPNEPKLLEPVSLAVGDALYAMDKRPHPGCASPSNCFEALTYDAPMDALSKPDWRWRRLPPPPYVLDPGYRPTLIQAYTAAGGGGGDGDGGCSDVWISSPGIGTYSFGTASASWSKVADWVLPFRGRASHAPELGVWLGFSASDNRLCSSDLAAAAAMRRGDEPPALAGAWDDLAAPADWILFKSCLVRLGPGRFCVARSRPSGATYRR
ncbi:hypothetical protein ACP4OV_022580 [Aristida adscensionis]